VKAHGGAMVVIAVSTVLFVLSMIAFARSYQAAIDARKASCVATLTALEAVSETSRAGIRGVSAVIPDGISPALANEFERQRANTIKENAARMKVITDAELAASKLKSSSYCQ